VRKRESHQGKLQENLRRWHDPDAILESERTPIKGKNANEAGDAHLGAHPALHHIRTRTAEMATNPDSDQSQRLATEGIAPMDRPGMFTRFFMAVVECAERLNFRYAKFGNPCVYDNKLFPWAAGIESNWTTIRSELDRVLARRDEFPNVQDITIDAKSITNDASWKIFLLLAYGVRSELNIALCPETWRIVQQIPGLKTAMFSVFEPGKRLPPHRGPYNGVLRLHLGLLVPEHDGNLAIRIGPEVRRWSEGRILIFDDAYEHEAWNETDKPRVVLFVDFEKPLKFPVSIINHLLLRLAVLTPFLREGKDNLRRWERQFHAS
jgi:ornithine lipid ester-linked acyl 2-hydroxylase